MLAGYTAGTRGGARWGQCWNGTVESGLPGKLTNLDHKESLGHLPLVFPLINVFPCFGIYVVEECYYLVNIVLQC